MSEDRTKVNSDGKLEQNPAREMGFGLNAAPNLISSSPESSLRSFRNEAEIYAISSALKRTGWNRKRAASLLSISYRGLLYKIRRHNIAPPGDGV